MLYRDGEAANAGMALGDTIKAVNGRPVSDYSWEEEHNLSDTPRQVLDIAGTDGQEKRIVLEAKLLW
jgi:C-terminal processing protease CtpA/Prc